MRTIHDMILDADQKSAHWLMVANDLKEKGRTCLGCGRGFIPRVTGGSTCLKCLRSLKSKDGRP